jgi:hypothetical protein
LSPDYASPSACVVFQFSRVVIISWTLCIVVVRLFNWLKKYSRNPICILFNLLKLEDVKSIFRLYRMLDFCCYTMVNVILRFIWLGRRDLCILQYYLSLILYCISVWQWLIELRLYLVFNVCNWVIAKQSIYLIWRS